MTSTKHALTIAAERLKADNGRCITELARLADSATTGSAEQLEDPDVAYAALMVGIDAERQLRRLIPFADQIDQTVHTAASWEGA